MKKVQVEKMLFEVGDQVVHTDVESTEEGGPVIWANDEWFIVMNEKYGPYTYRQGTDYVKLVD
jgi:hypothetical protein